MYCSLIINSPKHGNFKIKYDKRSHDLIKQYTWSIVLKDALFYVQSRTMGKLVYMHRILFKNCRGRVVDHINGNTLDNRMSNLRLCSIKNNVSNQKIHKNNTSGYKGVYWDRSKSKWCAKITVYYKTIFIGYYSNITDAAKAYNVEAMNRHGEFARKNKIKR